MIFSKRQKGDTPIGNKRTSSAEIERQAQEKRNTRVI